jgi:hypothetical protein
MWKCIFKGILVEYERTVRCRGNDLLTQEAKAGSERLHIAVLRSYDKAFIFPRDSPIKDSIGGVCAAPGLQISLAPAESSRWLNATDQIVKQLFFSCIGV